MQWVNVNVNVNDNGASTPVNNFPYIVIDLPHWDCFSKPLGIPLLTYTIPAVTHRSRVELRWCRRSFSACRHTDTDTDFEVTYYRVYQHVRMAHTRCSRKLVEETTEIYTIPFLYYHFPVLPIGDYDLTTNIYPSIYLRTVIVSMTSGTF